MGILNKAKSLLIDNMPYLRRPQNQSNLLQYMIENAWAFQSRDKGAGSGWDSYYEGMKNVWVNACINAYINEVLNVGFKINNPTDTKINLSHVTYLTNLFNDPMGFNSNDTYTILTSLLWRSKLGLGDAFCEVIYDVNYAKIPIGLKHVPTEYLKFYDDTDQWGFKKGSRRFERDELIHIYSPSIDGDIWGVAPLDNLSDDIANELLANNIMSETLENKGLNPRGVIEFDKEISKEEWDRQITELKEQAKLNKKGTLILKGGKYYSMANTMKDLEYQAMLLSIRDKTLATFNVPPSKISIIETGNLGTGTGESQDKNFKKTINGQSKFFEDAFRKVLGRAGFQEVFQYGEMDIDDKKSRAEIEDVRIRNGSSTVNEVRSSYGEEPVSWGDIPMVTSKLGTPMDLLGISDNTNILRNQTLIKPAIKDAITYKNQLKALKEVAI